MSRLGLAHLLHRSRPRIHVVTSRAAPVPRDVPMRPGFLLSFVCAYLGLAGLGLEQRLHSRLAEKFKFSQLSQIQSRDVSLLTDVSGFRGPASSPSPRRMATALDGRYGTGFCTLAGGGGGIDGGVGPAGRA